MRAEPSKLARLFIAYYQAFGRHVPESALRRLNAADLAAYLEDALTNRVPLSETRWDEPTPFGFSSRGCCIMINEDPSSEMPNMQSDGEWLH